MYISPKEELKVSFADILQVSKKGLSGRISSSFTKIKGRIPTSISTGSLFLDYILNGGYLRGTSQQFFGPSGAGKTTMAYRSIGANQKVDLELQKIGMGSLPNFLPKRAYEKLTYRPILICDAEGSTNDSFLTGCGVDLDPAKIVEKVGVKGKKEFVPTYPNELGKFSIFEPEYGEDWFYFHKRTCLAWYSEFHNKDSVILSPDYIAPLTLIDSLATLIPKSLLEDEQNQIAFLARLLSQFLPMQLAVDMKCYGVTYMVNQVRTNPMQFFGNPETIKGGAAPFHAASGNFRIGRAGKNEDVEYIFGDDQGGRNRVYTMTVGPKKCRWAPITGDSYELRTIMGKGFSRMSDMINYAYTSGQLKKVDGTIKLNLEVIGRPDLNIQAKEGDIKKHFIDKNLYEVFVLQLFTGAAWPDSELTKFQLETIGAIRTMDAPDIDLDLEQEIMELAESQKLVVEGQST